MTMDAVPSGDSNCRFQGTFGYMGMGDVSLIKEFDIHGWAINLEHLHLLIQPAGKYNYSEIMGTLKRNFSRDCNDLMAGKIFLAC